MKKEWRTDIGTVHEGAMRVFLLHIVFQPIIFWLIPKFITFDESRPTAAVPISFLVATLSIGVTQFLYLIPAFALLSTRRSDVFLGMLIAAGLTLLITSTCNTLFLLSWSAP